MGRRRRRDAWAAAAILASKSRCATVARRPGLIRHSPACGANAVDSGSTAPPARITRRRRYAPFIIRWGRDISSDALRCCALYTVRRQGRDA
jgi:hypothetical protein